MNTKCERKINVDSSTSCGRPATVFAMGQNVCLAHEPKGSSNCSHSLAPSGRCSYCGAVTEPDRDRTVRAAT